MLARGGRFPTRRGPDGFGAACATRPPAGVFVKQYRQQDTRRGAHVGAAERYLTIFLGIDISKVSRKGKSMFIQTEATPNPATLKFLPGQSVLGSGTADYPTADSAQPSPLARRVFAVSGVSAVFLGNDFVTVTKDDSIAWDHLKPAILGAIMEHFQSGQPVIEGENTAGGHTDHDGPDAEIVGQIKELLDTRVRPAVAQDGGDITFHGFERGVVYLAMKGACAGCPSSTMTLKMGIENLLRHYIPEVTEVRPVAV